MKTISTALTLIAALSTPFVAIAETESSEQDPNKPSIAVGATVGYVEATGLSFRKYFGANYLQTNFAGFVDKDKGEEYIAASISYGRYLNQFDLGKRGTPVGLKFVAGAEAEHDKGSGEGTNLDGITSDQEIHAGAGLGLEFGNPTRRGLVISVDLIYTAGFRGFKDREFRKLNLLPSASIHYNM
ncbi:MAG: hypothetical protein OEZ58_22825 [Gammaproteobacteria bacterium]|nr:hypothetical protein [Gammaproteobacteria bacterium]MDH5731827.1 hypothetical protein [Gammaproteobacteria bacterium]